MQLQLRSDHGSQYDSAYFMNEMKFLGLGMSKYFVRYQECNRIIEWIHSTLGEQVFQIKSFSTFQEAHDTIDQFIKDYNKDWILHRLNYYSPIKYREKYAQSLRKEKDENTTGNKQPKNRFVLILSG